MKQIAGRILQNVYALLFPLLYAACGGGAANVNVGSSLSEIAGSFGGISGIERQSDGGWLLTWTALADSQAVYAVYRANSEAEMSYAEPLKTTPQSSYKYLPDNVLSESKRCFAVRVMGTADANTKVLCNTAEASVFEGIGSLTSQSNGSYLLRWAKLPVDDAVYLIFERTSTGSYNFSQPSYQQKADFYNTNVIVRGVSKCFVVRVDHPSYGTDSNQKELCTTLEPAIVFTGPIGMSPSVPGTSTISWPASSTAGVVGYKIFSDSACTTPVACTPAGADGLVTGSSCSMTLVSGNQVCVIAVDSAGRESDPVLAAPVGQ